MLIACHLDGFADFLRWRKTVGKVSWLTFLSLVSDCEFPMSSPFFSFYPFLTASEAERINVLSVHLVDFFFARPRRHAFLSFFFPSVFIINLIKNGWDRLLPLMRCLGLGTVAAQADGVRGRMIGWSMNGDAAFWFLGSRCWSYFWIILAF